MSDDQTVVFTKDELATIFKLAMRWAFPEEETTRPTFTETLKVLGRIRGIEVTGDSHVN